MAASATGPSNPMLSKIKLAGSGTAREVTAPQVTLSTPMKPPVDGAGKAWRPGIHSIREIPPAYANPTNSGVPPMNPAGGIGFNRSDASMVP